MTEEDEKRERPARIDLDSPLPGREQSPRDLLIGRLDNLKGVHGSFRAVADAVRVSDAAVRSWRRPNGARPQPRVAVALARLQSDLSGRPLGEEVQLLLEELGWSEPGSGDSASELSGSMIEALVEAERARGNLEHRMPGLLARLETLVPRTSAGKQLALACYLTQETFVDKINGYFRANTVVHQISVLGWRSGYLTDTLNSVQFREFGERFLGKYPNHTLTTAIAHQGSDLSEIQSRVAEPVKRLREDIAGQGNKRWRFLLSGESYPGLGQVFEVAAAGGGEEVFGGLTLPVFEAAQASEVLLDWTNLALPLSSKNCEQLLASYGLSFSVADGTWRAEGWSELE